MAANSDSAKQAIHAARTRLMSNHPFYAQMSFGLKLRETAEIPTMATDGVHLFYNPDFTLSLTKKQLEALIAHETSHRYMEHPMRMEKVMGCVDKHKPDGVEPHTCALQIAQIAADFAINPILKDGGFDLPTDGAFPEKSHWNESFEEHFARMKKSAKTQQKCSGMCSGVKPYPGKDGKAPTQGELERAKADLQIAIMNAANTAKAAGKLPGHIERMIAELRAPIISWKDVLRRFMQATTKNDYRMMPPNRRYISEGLYLPSLRSEAVENVLLILDGSGSTCHIFPQFISEFASILLDVRPETLSVMVWDTRCTWLQQFDSYSDESLQSLAKTQEDMGAGGGTDFTHCFEHYNEKVGVTPQIAIVLTDMEMCGWPEDPGYPVMWVATTDIIGPFGETVRIEAE